MKKSPLIPLFLVVLIDVMGMTIILPLLPFYSKTLGASPFIVGMIVSVYGLCQFIAGPILGQMSDKMGRRKILIVSQIGTCIGFILLALSNNLFLIFLARIIDGITAGNITVAQAYISDVTEPKDRTHAFGMLGSAFSLGFIVGPAITGLLSKYGPHTPIYMAAFLSFLSIMATVFLLPDSQVQKSEGMNKLALKNIIHFIKDPQVGPLLFQFGTFIFAFAFFMSGFALFCGEKFSTGHTVFGIREVGYLFTFMGCVSLLVQMGFLKRLNQKYGEHKLVVAGFIAMAIGYFIIGETSTIPYLLGAMILTSFGSSVLRPSLTSQITKNVPRNQQGAILGVTQSIQSMAQISAPMIGGFMIGKGMLSGWAWTSSFVALLGFFVIRFQKRKVKEI
jgi:DHA1 family tetracycline resistance protein-like MFS transporter